MLMYAREWCAKSEKDDQEDGLPEPALPVDAAAATAAVPPNPTHPPRAQTHLTHHFPSPTLNTTRRRTRRQLRSELPSSYLPLCMSLSRPITSKTTSDLRCNRKIGCIKVPEGWLKASVRDWDTWVIEAEQ
ncbi:hypothetical protein BT96DRAFT_921261 [Gymnopus androsaceus JB14]|uniref:Uncharacterized protein n=1 Tax=Gymnopus androsaceus JB14 TaxID=1447944 RepID=A0A6A4GRX8_9AGAR|nr:hypothetical protein BT96DRAFT_927252 [Gymnopus androsaceus JB14]KAE9397694.1 hypothetical protein BT96DRAFT_921261 [Gymnopus androsaceus JB14]